MSSTWAGRPQWQRPKNWAATRARVLARDEYLCQLKGPRCKRTATEVDHRLPAWLLRRVGRLDLLEDERLMRATCGPCHRSKSSSDANLAKVKAPPPRHPGFTD